MKLCYRCALVGLVGVILHLPPAPAAETSRLDNGLQVILRPAADAKQAALVILYAVGGDHDPEGQSGLAHLIEHVYVTAAAGTTKMRTVDEYVKAYPRGWNAQTGDRYTVVATCFSSGDLDRELRDAAARMSDLRVTQADLDREKPRIVDEVANMFGRIPRLGAMNLAREAVRPTPLGGQKGGLPAQVEKLTVADVQARWAKYYKPRNAVLVLAGGFDAAAAKKAIGSHFGPIAGGEMPPAAGKPGKPRLAKPHVEEVKSRASKAEAEVTLAYAAPPPDGDLYAAYLVLLARIHAEGQKTATAGRFPLMCPLLDDPAVCYLGAAVKDGETGEQALQKLRDLVAAAAKPPLADGDAARAKETFGPMLGLTELPEAVAGVNPYFVAFTLGRGRQLGLDPVKLNAALTNLRDETLRRAAREVFGADRPGAAIVTPAK